MVSSEIERLRGRLDERTHEFERLRVEQMRDAKENVSLKVRLEELNRANETEKKQLENQMSHVIQPGWTVGISETKISTLQKALQDELAVSRAALLSREREEWLKGFRCLQHGAKQPKEQLVRMQTVVEGWQTQAESTQRAR